MIFDFRLRPPYKGFCDLSIFNPVCNSVSPHNVNARHSASAHEKSMALFMEEMQEAGIGKGVVMASAASNWAASVPNEDVRRLALQKAAQQVSYSPESITSIALDAGYESPEAFTCAFRSAFGVSPSHYRKKGSSQFSMRTDVGLYPFYHTNPEVSPVDVKVKVFTPVLVVSLRHVGPYDSCGPAWERLCGLLGPVGLCTPDATAYGISYDDPDTTPPEKCRMDVCLTMPEGVDGNTPALAELLPVQTEVPTHYNERQQSKVQEFSIRWAHGQTCSQKVLHSYPPVPHGIISKRAKNALLNDKFSRAFFVHFFGYLALRSSAKTASSV